VLDSPEGKNWTGLDTASDESAKVGCPESFRAKLLGGGGGVTLPNSNKAGNERKKKQKGMLVSTKAEFGHQASRAFAVLKGIWSNQK